MRYVYSMIRFVPDPARGEFVNVGTVVGSEDAGEWRLRLIDNLKRARALDDRGVLPSLWSFADEIGRCIDHAEASLESAVAEPVELTERWLEGLWQGYRNVVQLSRPAPLVAEDLEHAVSMVFDGLVVDPEHRRFPFASKQPVLAAARQAYLGGGIRKGIHIAERKVVKGKHHRQRFDFLVMNGQAVQLTQTWSFQRPDQQQLAEDVKAWAWSVQELREGGGVVDLATETMVRVPPDVEILAVYMPPLSSSAGVLDEAMSAFEDISVEPVTINDVGQIGRRAKELLVNSGVQLELGH